MARIQRMETGSLAGEYREETGADGQTRRKDPYFKHQAWVGGGNRTCRVPASEAPALREAIEGCRRFKSLSAEFIERTVAAARGENPEKNSTKLSTKRVAAKRRRSRARFDPDWKAARGPRWTCWKRACAKPSSKTDPVCWRACSTTRFTKGWRRRCCRAKGVATSREKPWEPSLETFASRGTIYIVSQDGTSRAPLDESLGLIEGRDLQK